VEGGKVLLSVSRAFGKSLEWLLTGDSAQTDKLSRSRQYDHRPADSRYRMTKKKNRHAVALERLGDFKGGKIRAAAHIPAAK
jgi:phosphopantetheine adenylyltransferase